MPNDLPATMRQIRSLVTDDGQLQLSLATVELAEPQPHEVVVRIEAAPINPSDLGLLLASADLETIAASGSADDPVVTATIPPQTLRGLTARLGESMPVGNEGAGVVVAAGSSDEAQALLGRTVAIIGGATYAEYRCLRRGHVPRPPRWHSACRRCVVLRQPAHRARDGRDDEDGGPHRAGSHCRGIEPRPDAAAHLPGRWGAARQHRPPPRAGRAARRPRRHTRVQLHRRQRSWKISLAR